jgi:hypothetical protein
LRNSFNDVKFLVAERGHLKVEEKKTRNLVEDRQWLKAQKTHLV